MHSRWRTLGALFALLLLTAGFYWKLTLTRDWTWLEGSDEANVVRPWLDFQAREFHAGRFPLWDPYEWAGHTLIGQVQPGITNPLNWVLFAMPLRDGHIPVKTLHWYWVLIHWLGAVACYALCRDLRAGHVASLAGAVVFALMGFVGHIDWPQILMTSIWVPIVFLFFARVARGCRPRSSAALCGAALGMAFLSGHHVVPTFTAVLLGAMWFAYLALPNGAATVRDRSSHAAICLAVWLLVSAVQVLPAIEYAKLSIRWAGAAEPLRWGEPVPYAVHAQYSLQWPTVPGIVLPGIALHVNPHVGFVALALALAAIWRRRDAAVRWFAALAAGGFLLSLGKDFPPYWLIYRFVPMVEKAREPAFAIVLFQLGIAVLAALGITHLRRPWIAPLVLALILGEAVNNAPRLARFDRPASYAATMQRQSDIADFLRGQPGWFRVDFDDADVPYNFGDFYGIEQFGGAVSSMPLRVHRMLGREETPRIYGVRYRVARKASDPGQQEVFASRSGLKVWRDPRIADPMSARRDTPCAAPDRFQVVSRAPEYFVMEADLACPALVLAGDSWYPGWRARVDGQRRPVQELDSVRAVRVDSGRHSIEFFYRPASVYWGFGFTLLGLLAVASLCAHDRRAAREL